MSSDLGYSFNNFYELITYQATKRPKKVALFVGKEKISYAEILKKADVNPDARVGFLTESEVDRIEEIIQDPAKYSLPGWLFNRRKDGETGKDMHITSAELVLKTKNDIDQAKEIRSWRGYRHAYSLKVRGQRTKTTGRAGKALGVKKKTATAKPGGA